MPAVITFSGSTESGHSYADILWESYSFPSRYQRILIPGRRVLFYTGRRSVVGRPDPRYLGAGTIGNVWDAGEKSGRYRLLQCETVDIVRFPAPVPVKDADGEYLESDANRTQHVGLYFSQGVRTISVHDYKRILRACVDLDPVDEPNWQG